MNAISVEGNISEDTFWNVDSVFVTGNLTIDEAVTLTISQGTTLLFQSNISLNVRGSIIANGTAEAPIIFKQVNFPWGGIKFDQTPASSDSSIFKYCTIKSGITGPSSYYGGGIYVDGFSKIRFDHCYFTRNAHSSGGALSIKNSDGIIIDNCDFYKNYAYSFGAGLYCANSNLKIKNSNIHHNQDIGTVNNFNGMGIYCNASNVELINTEIKENGGYVSAYNHSATQKGIGIYATNSELKIINCKILKNGVFYESSGSGYDGISLYGLGIYGTNSNIAIYNSDILYNDGGECFPNGNLFTNNISLYGNSDMTLINSIVWADESSYLSFLCSNSNCSISHSDIFGGEEGVLLEDNATLNWSDTNINSEPLFINGTYPDLNFHLFADSPLINAGTPDITGLFLPPYDLDGNARVYDGIIDIGCYEWQGTNSDNDELQFTNYKLSNYPNPFNPTTTIYFESPDSKKSVQIEIFNIKGQKIKQLKIENVKSGKNKIVWDGVNEFGKHIASGVYLYRLNVKNSPIKKMILLK